MSTTTPADVPTVARFISPDLVAGIVHEPTRAEAEHVAALTAAANEARSRLGAVMADELDQAAHAADHAAATAAASAPGDFADPGTPAADKLRQERAAAQREALARVEAAEAAQRRFRRNLRDNLDDATATHRKGIDAVRKGIDTLVAKVAKDQEQLDHDLALLGWLERVSTNSAGMQSVPRRGLAAEVHHTLTTAARRVADPNS